MFGGKPKAAMRTPLIHDRLEHVHDNTSFHKGAQSLAVSDNTQDVNTNIISKEASKSAFEEGLKTKGVRAMESFHNLLLLASFGELDRVVKNVNLRVIGNVKGVAEIHVYRAHVQVSGCNHHLNACSQYRIGAVGEPTKTG